MGSTAAQCGIEVHHHGISSQGGASFDHVYAVVGSGCFAAIAFQRYGIKCAIGRGHPRHLVATCTASENRQRSSQPPALHQGPLGLHLGAMQTNPAYYRGSTHQSGGLVCRGVQSPFILLRLPFLHTVTVAAEPRISPWGRAGCCRPLWCRNLSIGAQKSRNPEDPSVTVRRTTRRPRLYAGPAPHRFPVPQVPPDIRRCRALQLHAPRYQIQ